jgi:O-acetyl-ADP-ribose deacetylase (regulator of RNase III)
MKTTVERRRLRLRQGDITQVQVDAIVNAANSSLMGRGGVDAAIHRAGGVSVLEEHKRIVTQRGPLPASQAVITTGGNLPARYVIHTVGPIWQGGPEQRAQPAGQRLPGEPELAADHSLRTVAFPSISTGAYGYPVLRAARVALSEAVAFLERESSLVEIPFVLFDSGTVEAYQEALTELRPGGEGT